MSVQLSDVNASGTESLLGIADGPDPLDSDTARQRLALSTRYLANWYKATSGSPNQDIWWQQIDTVRLKIQAVYQELLAPEALYFMSSKEKADYNDASKAWVDLYDTLTLSPDANQYGLLDQAADMASTLAESPAAFVTAMGDQIGQAAGGLLGNAFGQFMARAWVPVTVGAVIFGLWIFRKQISKAAG